ncbi:MAG: HNH endonuclease [Aquincola tertiaricarbonis]
MNELLNELRRRLSYDAASGKLTWRVHARHALVGKNAGSANRLGYIRFKLSGRFILAHRAAWALHFGEWPAADLDHIDGNKANNRIENLRLASAAENAQNRTLHRNNSSGFPGVYAMQGRWRARIRVPGKRLSLGLFDTPEEAHTAYAAAKARLHTFQPVSRLCSPGSEA